MKKAVFVLFGLCIAAAGFGVYTFFEKFNRARNADAPRPELIVFASSSFLDPYGPGPFLKTEFEKICLCDVKMVDPGAAEVMFQKLALAGEVVDVVLGLDQINLKRATQVMKWKSLKVPERQWADVFNMKGFALFIPYDWSPLTFISRKDENLPVETTLAEYLKALKNKSLVLQDPDLSSPGLQLVYWRTLLPEAFANLQTKVQRLAPDWSAAYGLFKKRQAAATFTYLTSIVYHWEEEKDFNFEVASLSDGHVAQIEYAGVPETCRSCALAERFVEYLTELGPQKEIMRRNFMLPINKGALVGSIFETLPNLKIIGSDQMENFSDHRDEHVKEFRDALGFK